MSFEEWFSDYISRGKPGYDPYQNRPVDDRLRYLRRWEAAKSARIPPPSLGPLGRMGIGLTGPAFPSDTPFGKPLPGEKPALQMPGLMPAARAARDWFVSGYPDTPPGFRAMPRTPGYQTTLFGYPFPERDTEVIPGPPQPPATPYPRPPNLNFRNWIDSGEREPIPLDYLPEGKYPDPYYNTPQMLDTRQPGGIMLT
jgi:hypothetical protein